MLKIKIHYFSPDAPRLKITDKGDWIDLYCAETMELHAGDFTLVPLGVSMQLPAGYEARTAPRSSTFRRWGILQANSVGVIDSDYARSDNEGHIFLRMTNDSREGKGLRIAAGTAFAQGIFLPFGITVDDEASAVRNGGFGSTTRA